MDFIPPNLFVDLKPCKYDVFDHCDFDVCTPEVCEFCLCKAREIIDAGYRKLCRDEKEFFRKRLLNDIKKGGDVDGERLSSSKEK